MMPTALMFATNCWSASSPAEARRGLLGLNLRVRGLTVCNSICGISVWVWDFFLRTRAGHHGRSAGAKAVRRLSRGTREGRYTGIEAACGRETRPLSPVRPAVVRGSSLCLHGRVFGRFFQLFLRDVSHGCGCWIIGAEDLGIWHNETLPEGIDLVCEQFVGHHQALDFMD